MRITEFGFAGSGGARTKRTRSPAVEVFSNGRTPPGGYFNGPYGPDRIGIYGASPRYTSNMLRDVRYTGQIPTTAHDIRVDLVVTPERMIRCRRGRRARARIRWDELTDAKIASIPLLQRLATGPATG